MSDRAFRGWAFVAAPLCVLALVLASFAPALADGTPLVIPLRYISGISNFGPQNATGEADIVLVEGDISITVNGLPPLTSDLYQAWLFNTKTGDRLSLGKFNTSAQNSGQLQTVVDLSGKAFDLVAITVQPEPPPDSLPDPRLSIAGFFSALGTPVATPAPGDVATPTPVTENFPGLTPSPLGLPPGAPAPGVGTPAAATPLPPVPAKLPSTGGSPLIPVGIAGLVLIGAGRWLTRRRGGK